MVEEALLRAIGKLIVYLRGKLQQELSVTSDAETELKNLEYWQAAINDFLKKARPVELPNETLKAAINEMQQFLSDSQSAINIYKQSAHGGNGNLTGIRNHFNSRNFAGKAKDAKQKLATCLDTLNTAMGSLETFQKLSGDQNQARSASYRSSSIAYSEEKHEVFVGIEEPKDQLFQLLTGAGLMSKVIFVQGTQGIGKTSLVGAVLRDQRVRAHFKYYVWIKARDIEEVLMKAVAMVWDPTKNDDQGDQVELAEVFKRMWNNKCRWALVLDDASRADVFQHLKRHLFETRVSVLVTTRISSLASSSKLYLDSLGAQSGGASPEPSKCRYGFPIFKLAVLSTDDSHKLFCRKMLGKDTCPPGFKDAFDSILEKCGGLPLAILAMCEHLIHRQRGDDTPQYVEWTKWSGSVGNLLFSPLSNCDDYGSIRRMKTQYVDHLHSVQTCVSYLSIFPLDCPLRCSTLMRLWMAEGFPKEKGTNLDPTISEETLTKLVDHNIFQEVKKTSYGRVGSCRVNNLLHQIIISRSKNDKFAMIVTGQEEEWLDTIERLSFHSNLESEVEGMKVKRLCSLHAFKKVCLKSMKKLLGQVESLEVLDLQRLLTKVEKDYYQDSLKSFPEEILCLKYLRYLSLRDTKVKKIPDRIKHLECLETLDLKGTDVSELPDGILELARLRHLLVYRSDRRLAVGTDPKHGVKAPSKLGVLRSLRKLCMIELDPVKKGRRGRKNKKRRQLLEKEIGKLTNLQRLGISMLRSTDVTLLFSSIGKLTTLEALRLIAAPEQKINLSEEDERNVPSTLKRVHLTGYLGASPHWILSFTSLVKLVLKGSQLNGDPLQHLGELLYLKHLKLQQAFDVSEVTFKAGRFQELCFLDLDAIDSLQSIKVEEEALPTLEILSLGRCKSLKTVPPDITRPRKLKCLKLYGMPEEFMTAVEGNEVVPARIKVQPKVWKEGAVEEVQMPSTNRARRFPGLPMSKG